MANPRKVKKQQSSATAKLSGALDFVMPAYKEKGASFEPYCRIGNKQIIAFDGIVALGHPIDEELSICPHLGRLAVAIKGAGDTLNLTELDSGRLSVKGDNLRAIIPCVDPATIPAIMPDPRCAVVDDRIREGMAAVTGVIKEGDPNTRWIETCALLRANTIFATNGHMAVEYFHGIDLPPGLNVPKAALTAVIKTAKPIVGFGFSASSVTFYFEDDAWMRTQLFNEVFPDVDRVMEAHFRGRLPRDLAECPPSLFEAIAAVAPHAETDAVFLGPGIVKSHGVDNVGADYPVEGLAGYAVINSGYMKIIAPYAKRIDISNHDSLIFYGDAVRGIVMKMRG